MMSHFVKLHVLLNLVKEGCRIGESGDCASGCSSRGLDARFQLVWIAKARNALYLFSRN